MQVVRFNRTPMVNHHTLCAQRMAKHAVPAVKRNTAAVCFSASKKHIPSCFGRDLLGQLTDQQDPGPWKINVMVNGLPVKFKVNTGANVTVMPTSLYDEQVMGNMKQANEQLLGPNWTKIATVRLHCDPVLKWLVVSRRNLCNRLAA